jgi:hypothetical protein
MRNLASNSASNAKQQEFLPLFDTSVAYKPRSTSGINIAIGFVVLLIFACVGAGIYLLLPNIGAKIGISNEHLPQYTSTTSSSTAPAEGGSPTTADSSKSTRIANDVYKILLTKYSVSNLKDVAAKGALSPEVAGVISTIYSFADRADGDVSIKVSLKASETTKEVLANAAAVIYADAKPSTPSLKTISIATADSSITVNYPS